MSEERTKIIQWRLVAGMYGTALVSTLFLIALLQRGYTLDWESFGIFLLIVIVLSWWNVKISTVKVVD